MQTNYHVLFLNINADGFSHFINYYKYLLQYVAVLYL